MTRNSGRVRFDGGAETYVGTALLAFLITVCTLGIYGFWVGPRIQRWKWEHTDFDSTGAANPMPSGAPPVLVLAGAPEPHHAGPVATGMSVDRH